jgi:hypothetical protein
MAWWTWLGIGAAVVAFFGMLRWALADYFLDHFGPRTDG